MHYARKFNTLKADEVTTKRDALFGAGKQTAGNFATFLMYSVCWILQEVKPPG
ncbi:hypothetical protein HY3_03355 [Hyphomonas pacifica]|uniref:Uncharacterized protein n=1 Tax=Hyphomonas pacifica TaxID=1280941 RepID=A0A062U4U6_9PROT|nr:hypothetical protein HY2_07520 [Hyphomonas pacifica]RAN32378.1 hypothetical protein HY3_03355 [Hyphomonas pacifica]